MASEPLHLPVKRSKGGSLYTDKSGQLGMARTALAAALKEERPVILDLRPVRGNVKSSRLRKLVEKVKAIAHSKGVERARIELLVPEHLSHAVEQAFVRPLRLLELEDRDFTLSERTRTVYSSRLVFAVKPWERRADTLQVLKALIARDGQDCVWCGRTLSAHDRQATIDHVKPRSRGGRDRLDNYLLSCYSCNYTRGDRPAEEWLTACLGHSERRPCLALVEAALDRAGVVSAAAAESERALAAVAA